MSVSVTVKWLEAQEAAHRRTLVRGLALSCALHLGIGLFLAFSPQVTPARAPEVISVRMVSLPQAAVPAPATPAAPEPVPAQPRPAPVPKKVILPKQPSAVSKKPKRKPKPKPLEYDDALAALREELGEQTPVPEAPAVAEEVVEVAKVENSESARPGAESDPVILAWRLATRRHLRKVWVVPPEFLEQALSTDVIVTLAGTGDVLGAPAVARSSGNPYWDDNIVRALVRASPLPPPPEPGDWPFRFTPREGQ